MHWIRNIHYLSKTRTVWAPDIPGFGASALPSPTQSIRAVASALGDGLSVLAIKEPLAIVGFSFGGTVAAHLAASAPGKIKKAALARLRSQISRS